MLVRVRFDWYKPNPDFGKHEQRFAAPFMFAREHTCFIHVYDYADIDRKVWDLYLSKRQSTRKADKRIFNCRPTGYSIDILEGQKALKWKGRDYSIVWCAKWEPAWACSF